jgi:spermidine synthase
MFFGMNQPNLQPLAVDGRWGLENSGQTYSLISIDAYRPPYIPWHLTTREFFQVVYDHLTPDGAMALNVGRTPEEEELLAGLVSTIQTVFPSVYVMDLPYSYNSMIYATVQPTRAENLEENYRFVQDTENQTGILAAALDSAVQNLRPLPEGRVVFTDDRAPVEWITNNMVLNYILSGDEY